MKHIKYIIIPFGSLLVNFNKLDAQKIQYIVLKKKYHYKVMIAIIYLLIRKKKPLCFTWH
jgi:hypothetical protein